MAETASACTCIGSHTGNHFGDCPLALEETSYTKHYAGERRQGWTTPRSLFDPLHAEFGFTMDGASDGGNALMPRFHVADDILVSWAGERVFCNPPWNRISEFIELAAFADLAVLLVPARTNSRWFHRALELGAEVRFFLGRPAFESGPDDQKGHNSPVDCLWLVFGNRAGFPSEGGRHG